MEMMLLLIVDKAAKQLIMPTWYFCQTLRSPASEFPHILSGVITVVCMCFTVRPMTAAVYRWAKGRRSAPLLGNRLSI